MNSKQRPRRKKGRVRPIAGSGRNVGIAPPPLYFQALRLHREGKLVEAKDLYCEILSSDPNQADAWHMLGMLLFQAGESTQALECLTRAVRLNPSDSSLLSNLGAVYLSLKNLKEACHWLSKAIQLNADDANAQNNLGVVFLEQHLPERAEPHFLKAKQLDPEHRDATTNLGNALQHQGRFAEAIPIYQEALTRCPNDQAVWNNLGSTHKKLKQYRLAYDAFQKAIGLGPSFEEARLNLATTLLAMDRLEDALEYYETLVRETAPTARVHHYHGEALNKAGQYEAAKSCFEQSIRLDPDYAFAYIGLSAVLQQRGEISLAIENLRKAMERRPDLSVAHSTLLFVMSADPNVGPEELLREHQAWGTKYGNVEPVFIHRPNPGRSGRSLRVGYVSPDFRMHAVAEYFEPVLVEHANGSLETFCYSEAPNEDSMTEHLKQFASHWRSTTGLSDLQVAQMIHRDKIDVLVDLAGHTGGNRLRALAYKPAPVQITWLGYPNTTGLDAIDYRLTTAMQDPVGNETPHVEQLVRLPNADVIRPPAAAPSDVAPPPCLQNGFVTFGSFHRYQKISEQALDVWAAVLQAIPTSRLLAFNTSFVGDVQKNLRQQLVNRGVEAERFEIRNQTDAAHYLCLYNEVDIALDVFPWNGGTTTREALWMGVAVIGLFGDRRSSRGTATTLHTAGLDQLIANSPAEYVQIARRLASNPDELKTLRTSMRPQMLKTLCNGKKFTRELEEAYFEVWDRWNSSTNEAG